MAAVYLLHPSYFVMDLYMRGERRRRGKGRGLPESSIRGAGADSWRRKPSRGCKSEGREIGPARVTGFACIGGCLPRGAGGRLDGIGLTCGCGKESGDRAHEEGVRRLLVFFLA